MRVELIIVVFSLVRLDLDHNLVLYKLALLGEEFLLVELRLLSAFLEFRGAEAGHDWVTQLSRKRHRDGACQVLNLRIDHVGRHHVTVGFGTMLTLPALIAFFNHFLAAVGTRQINRFFVNLFHKALNLSELRLWVGLVLHHFDFQKHLLNTPQLLALLLKWRSVALLRSRCH